MKEKKKEIIIIEDIKKVRQQVKEKNYDIGETQVFKQHSQKVSNEVIYFFIDYLKSKNYKFCVAPYEADAQLYYLYKKKQIDYIYSEDSDIIIYNCKHIVRSLQKNEFCKVLDPDILKQKKKQLSQQRKIDNKIDKAIYFYELSDRDRIKIGIMCGCDFVSNIKSLGFSKIIDFFDNDYDEDKQIEEYYNKQLAKKQENLLPYGIKNITQYLKIVKYAQLSFQFQLIFDFSDKISLQPMNKWKKSPKISKKRKDIYSIEDFIGSKSIFDKVDLEQFYKGNLDFVTFKKRQSNSYNYDKAFQFIQLQPRMKSGLLNNLCVDSFGYNNFQQFFSKDKQRIFQEKESQDESDVASINN